jgi:hypothetical protein
MVNDRQRTARGALAGAAAALVWAVQQPIDKRVFGVDYDDCDILGTAVTSGSAVRPVGWAMHIGNGAMFGALYANFARRLPLPAWACGPVMAVAENTLLWPLTAVLPRVHPAGAKLPPLWGSRRAFAQATWRHVLFGVVLGELERRMNAGDDPEPVADEPHVSSNGHGDIRRAVVTIAPE